MTFPKQTNFGKALRCRNGFDGLILILPDNIPVLMMADTVMSVVV